ncbi:MAG: tetratricopeptide repeat protein [Kiritimatiellae bacterium]|nr:tetratricopeptide repeat protein [Kiritimatiellia bacterium]
MSRADSIQRFVIPLLLVAAVAATFWQACAFGFVDWDDNSNVYENPWLQPVSGRSVARFWRGPYESLYVPVTYTVWAALARGAAGRTAAAAARFDARWFHIANLVLHALSVLCVFAILRRCLSWVDSPASPGDRRRVPAAAGALLFALHPVQVEAVVWVTGMKDVLCGLLALLALLQYMRFLEYIPVESDDARFRPARAAGHAALAGAAFVLAVLAKPSAVIVPVMAGLLALLQRSRRRFRRLPAAAVLAVWAAVAVVAVVVTRRAQPLARTNFTVSPWLRPLIAGDAVLFYVYKILWPFRLGLDYGRSPWLLTRQWWFWFSGAACWAAGFAWLAALWLNTRLRRAVRRGAPALAAVALFLSALLPVLGLVPFKYQSMSTVADRYLYLAMLGPAFGFALLARPRAGGRRAALRHACLAALLLFWAVRSACQVRVWRDSVALFEHGLAVNPGSWTLGNNLGVLLAKTGRMDEALAHFSAVLDRYPGDTDAHVNLGKAYGELGRREQGLRHYRAALQLSPADADVHYNLGVLLSDMGRAAEAAGHFSTALRLEPGYLSAHLNLGELFAGQGRREEARAHLSAALGLAPAGPDADRIRARLRTLGPDSR